MSPFLIYALVDPRSDAVRYIGKSCAGMRRPAQHTKPAALLKSAGTHRTCWIKSLLALHLKPAIRVLEEFETEADLNDAERFWIAQGLGLGWSLTNHTKGGDGGNVGPAGIAKIVAATRQRVVTQETRARMSAAHTGRKFTPEWGAKISAARMGHTVSPETRAKIAASLRGRRRG